MKGCEVLVRRRNLGITIDIEGNTQPLQKALGDVDKASRQSEAELRKINRALKFDEGNTTLLAQQFEVLEETIQSTANRLDILKSAKADVDREFAAGNIDASAYREFNREIEITENRLKQFRQQAADIKVDVQADTSRLDRVKGALRDIATEAKQAGQEIGQGIAAGAAAGAAALGGLALQGGEVARDLGRLNAVLTNQGFDNSEGQFDGLLTETAALNGDINATVEAINNLANTDLNQSQLETTLRQLSGAAIQFSETLSLEGLADGLQETLAIGEGTGSFGEYLERSGINLENFNEQLAAAKANGTDLDFVLETLSKTGAQDFLDTYTDINGELYSYQQSQAELEVAISRLTIALAPVISSIAGIISGLANWAAENPVLTQTLFVVLGVITALAGIFAVLAPIIGSIISLASALGVGIAAVLTPIGAVIAGVGAFIALAGVLIAAWEPITDFFKGLWDGIVNAFEYSVDLIKTLLSGILEFIKAPINYLIEGVNDLIRGINKIKIPDNIPVIGGAGFNFPTIPKFARGTDYFRGGLALVGEEGPELVNLPRGSAVNTASETRDLLSGGININVQNLAVREEADIQRIARELYRMYQVEQRGR